MKSLCVIGSLNMDLITTVENFPLAGQTIMGKEFNTFPGGKGGNQAIALGRLGSDVLMVGKIGGDIYGTRYLEVLRNNNVKYDGVSIEKGMSSGVAVIQVSNNGENNIIVVPGANAEVDINYIESKWSLIERADIFLFQLEIPLETVIATMKKLKKQGKTVILDPAPALDLPDEIFKYVDYLTPNETELETLIGRKINSEENFAEAAQTLFDKGVKVIVAKLGSDGAAIIKKDKCTRVPGFIVDPIDTTAAGDSFNAGFAFALAKEKELKECVIFGNAVGAISTTALGAQEAMPTFERVDKFIRDR
ncbi:ribokinase [Clostridium beijerinckii]|uniref:ribokinase n=1 Tax=Clostridium beijerinckii TaxID=1520 RepID=UPI001494158C|nr:ribokinase [Clostridium beijerinckii]NOW05786.1 ribokinase [Clostridium beijerinckii]NYC01070.1 ribokinase [Clostridium beijerinckii]